MQLSIDEFKQLIEHSYNQGINVGWEKARKHYQPKNPEFEAMVAAKQKAYEDSLGRVNEAQLRQRDVQSVEVPPTSNDAIGGALEGLPDDDIPF